jgi:hypothetical protein
MRKKGRERERERTRKKERARKYKMNENVIIMMQCCCCESIEQNLRGFEFLLFWTFHFNKAPFIGTYMVHTWVPTRKLFQVGSSISASKRRIHSSL